MIRNLRVANLSAPRANFRNWITADGTPGPSGEGGFPARVRPIPSLCVLCLSLGASRTLIFRALKGPAGSHQCMSVVHPDMLNRRLEFRHGLLPGRNRRHALWAALRPRYLSQGSIRQYPAACHGSDPLGQESARQSCPTKVRKSSACSTAPSTDLTGNSDDYWPARDARRDRAR